MLDEFSRKKLEVLVGNEKLEIFDILYEYIKNTYDVECSFQELKYVNKLWPAKYEVKFAKGGKKMTAFYFAENRLGLSIIFGKDERIKVENMKDELSNKAYKIYDDEEIYHDGKWVMFELEDLSLIEDIKKLLPIKRKPKN